MDEIEKFKEGYEKPLRGFIGNFISHSHDRTYRLLDPVSHDQLENDAIPASLSAIEQFNASYQFMERTDSVISIDWLYGRHLTDEDLGAPGKFENMIKNYDVYLPEMFFASNTDLSFLNKVSRGDSSNNTIDNWLHQQTYEHSSRFFTRLVYAIQDSKIYIDTFDVHRETALLLPEIYRTLFSQKIKHDEMFKKYPTEEEIAKYSEGEKYAYKTSLYIYNLLNELAGFYREKLWIMGFAVAMHRYMLDNHGPTKVSVLATAGAGHYGFGKIIDGHFGTHSNEEWLVLNDESKNRAIERSLKKRNVELSL